MYFVSNQHILVRFKDSKTVTLRSNGTIVNQIQRVQEILDNKNTSVVAATNVEFGKMFLTLFDSSEKELRTLVFGSDGKAELVGIFTASKKSIRDSILEDQKIKLLAEKWGMKALGVDSNNAFGEENKEIAVMNQVSNSFKLSTKHLF